MSDIVPGANIIDYQGHQIRVLRTAFDLEIWLPETLIQATRNRQDLLGLYNLCCLNPWHDATISRQSDQYWIVRGKYREPGTQNGSERNHSAIGADAG